MQAVPDPRSGARGGWSRRGPNRVRRGDVQAAVLALLAESDMHGYQIIQELAERSGGGWRPGAGSIYPTLRQLQEQGFIRSRNDGSKRVFSITDYGRRTVTESGGTKPWEAYAESRGASAKLREASQSLFSALALLDETSDDTLREQATAIITQARRSVYLMLAGDDA